MIAILGALTTAWAAAAVDVKARAARGDGLADDTAALQLAITTAAASQETLQIPGGVYLIDAKLGLTVPSGSRIELAPDAVLRAIPNALDHSRILKLDSVTDVQITGGVIEGDRDLHTGKTGEWGHGIDVRASRQVLIRGTTIRSCWGDGIYIGGNSQQIEIVEVICSDNRRQGLSITSGSGIKVRNSTFQKTHGTAPECGIDVEPNRGETITNCQIVECRILDNVGGGIQVGPSNADQGQAFVRGFLADGCSVERNGTRPPSYAIHIVNSENAIIRKNRLTGNLGIGIGVTNSVGSQVLQNIVTRTRLTTNRSDAGMLFTADQQTTVRDNLVTDNEGYGVFLWKTPTQVAGNRISGNRKGEVRK